jgi:hypothetical protein
MNNWQRVKEQVLLQSKRYCCFCLKYKGRDIEVHHIIPKAKGGADTFDNAIPLCFDCHSEIGSYNPEHPKGNKYTYGELKKIRDDNYDTIVNLPRNPKTISSNDEKLLEEFKTDYTDILEYCIETDFTSELVCMSLSEKIYYLNSEKWSKKRFNFEDNHLEEIKIEILNTLDDLRKYVSPEYLRLHEPSGKLIFKNQSWEEGERLRNDFRPNSIRIRKELQKLLERLYSY